MRRLIGAIAGALALSGVAALSGSTQPTAQATRPVPRLVALHTAVPQTVGIRLVDVPSSQAGNPRDLEYIVDHVHPGTTITRHVEIVNGTSAPQVVQVYAAAADISGGSIHFGAGRAVNELTTWTNVSPSTVNPATGGNAMATVTIAVPATASAGERYAVVWAQLAPAVPVGGGVTTVNRVGIRIYLSVGPGGDPPTNFSITALQAQRASNGSPAVAASIHNTGGLAIDLSGKLQLSNGPGGLSAGPFAARLGTTLGPGQAEQVLVPLAKAIPRGPWRAHLVLTSGLTVRDATATLTFPAVGASPAAPVKASSGSSGTPVLVLVVAGAALLILIVATLVFRRRRTSARKA